MTVEMPCWSEQYTREELLSTLGKPGPYFRYIKFPVEVEIEFFGRGNVLEKDTEIKRDDSIK